MTEVTRRGSLAGVDGVPAAAREVFKTAHEIDAVWHVRHQAAFQKHTDNGVSKTITCPRARPRRTSRPPTGGPGISAVSASPSSATAPRAARSSTMGLRGEGAPRSRASVA